MQAIGEKSCQSKIAIKSIREENCAAAEENVVEYL
jgi:hypothetical protein